MRKVGGGGGGRGIFGLALALKSLVELCLLGCLVGVR